MKLATRVAIALTVLALGLFAAACGDDDNGATPTKATTASPVATAAPTARPTTTGIASVDAAIRAVLANDAAALAAQFAFFKVKCSANPSCNADQLEGTPVDVFLWKDGQDAYFRPADVSFALEKWLSLRAELYAVVKLATPDAGAGGAQYEVVFVNGVGAANELLVSDAGITGIVFDDTHDPAARAGVDGTTRTYVIQPPAPGTPTPAPTAPPTGVAVIDGVVKAVESNDAVALKSLFAYFKVNCSVNPSGGFPFPPQCKAGETDGTPVDVLLASPGEGVFFRPDEADRELAAWLSPGMRLYAVRDRLSPDAAYGDHRYDVVFVNAKGAANSLGLSDKGVVIVAFDLSFNPAQAAQLPAGWKYIVPPQR